MEENAEYELREARSEISRHHKLIAEMRESLEWALDFIATDYEFEFLNDEYRLRYDESRKLLNRQVG